MAQTDPPAEESDAPVPQDPKLALAQKKFILQTQTASPQDKAKLEQELQEACFADNLAPTYEALCEELGWLQDAARLQQMQQANRDRLQALDEQLQDAEENLGDIEVRNACLARADFLCSIGDRAAAAEAYRATLKKTAGVGSKTDIVLSMLRQEMACGDWWAVRDSIKQAKELCAKGGDWERKNRLKVYEALFAVSTRDFATAARLFLDSIATFTATELFPYETCIFFTVVTALITLPRQELKAKVVDAPEILTIISTIPHLETFLNSFYSCRYAEFLQAFAALTDVIKADRYLHPHYRFYVREVRKAAYVQFLDAYKSVTLESMAQSFGVSAAFIDAELEEFIVAGRLTAKIDKVAGVVETNRADAKNAHYQATIKQGDLLLNRLQRLAKIIDVE